MLHFIFHDKNPFQEIYFIMGRASFSTASAAATLSSSGLLSILSGRSAPPNGCSCPPLFIPPTVTSRMSSYWPAHLSILINALEHVFVRVLCVFVRSTNKVIADDGSSWILLTKWLTSDSSFELRYIFSLVCSLLRLLLTKNTIWKAHTVSSSLHCGVQGTTDFHFIH